MLSSGFILECNAQFGMENPEMEIGSYDDNKQSEAFSHDNSENNEASE